MALTNPRAKTQHDTVILLDSTTTSDATGEGDSIRLPGFVHGIAFIFDLTAAKTDNADTLDVYVQTYLGEIGWVDVVHFTQIEGDGSPATYCSKVHADGSATEFELSDSLAASSARHILGDEWRVRWEITDADADAEFTFSVHACPM